MRTLEKALVASTLSQRSPDARGSRDHTVDLVVAMSKLTQEVRARLKGAEESSRSFLHFQTFPQHSSLGAHEHLWVI